MCDVRKLLFCVFISVLSVTAYAVTDYKAMLKSCDELAQKGQQNASSTIQMVRIVEEQKDCYKNVANKIIDAEYAKNKQQMVSEFNNFIKISSDMAYSMQYPDSCDPNCGTIVGLNAANSDLEIIKAYVQQLLHIVSPK